ncbi:MAG: COX15/CtaA family protein [Phycisphaerales bacterium]|nr:COX15/CtaA family protein [Phycisphaerales bacterium]
MTQQATRPSVLAIALPTGFAAASAMWVVGFLTRLPAIDLPGPVTAAVLGAILFGASARAGYRRVTPVHAVLCGVGTALVAAVVNLMILGSLLTDESGGEHPSIALAILGFFGGSAVLGGIAGAIAGHLGRNNPRPRDETGGRAHFAAFAIIAAFAMLPVLLVGGLVTSNDAGLSVPDWPTSYGLNMVLFPLSRMTGGIYYEHAHRLFGMLAGLGVVLLLAWAIVRAIKGDRSHPASAPRRDVALALIALLAVSLQGVLGGVRVTEASGSSDPANITTNYDAARDAGEINQPNFALTRDTKGSRGLALVHGVTGQLTFALLAVIAAMLCPAWISARERARNGDAHPHDRTLQATAYFLVGAVFLQLAMGATVRHTHQTHALYTHIGLAFVVVFLAAIAGLRAISKQRHIRNLRRFGNGALHSTLAQFTLGWAALFVVVPRYGEAPPDPAAAVIVATAHQFIGAIVIAMSALLAAWTWRETHASQRNTRAADAANSEGDAQP